MPSEPATERDAPGAGPLPWLAVAALTAALTGWTAYHALQRYDDFRSGWSWDLAYYNQWYWALTRGDGLLTVRPTSAFADEGPSVWKTNYLSPLRYLLIPWHYAWPDPRSLLVAQAVLLWWVIPASFQLVRGETRSTPIALAATALVPLTPLLWPLAWNDFREIQIALPFVVWGVSGVRARHFKLAAWGIGGMLACRQEMAVVVATFALLKPRDSEDIGRTLRWRHALVLLGLSWLLLGYFGYLRFFVARSAPELYLAQFTGPGAPLGQTLTTGAELLFVGLGCWSVLLCFAPRESLLMFPWLWSLASGKWALRFLATEEWHHVRYAAPVVALGLAAGLIGFGRLALVLIRRPRGALWLVVVVSLLASFSLVELREIDARMDRQPQSIGAAEAASLRYWVRQVGPKEGVLAVYDVTAPLSSRRTLYSYVLTMNQPKGYPQLPAGVGWVFCRNSDGDTAVFQGQGFEAVSRGPHITVLRRRGAPGQVIK